MNKEKDPDISKTITLPKSMFDKIERMAEREERRLSAQIRFMLKLVLDNCKKF